MKIIFALVLALVSFNVEAQDLSTSNLIGNTWTNTNNINGCQGYSGGSTAGYISATGTLCFGYSQATVAQTIAVNQALSGSGVQVGGYNYGWSVYNNDTSRGTLSATVALKNSGGATLESYSYNLNTQSASWQTYSGSQNFSSSYALSNLGNISLSFTGKDDRFWAGYYGPQVKDISLSLKYTVDPCVANPAVSPNCSGYNDIITSNAIYATSYAINSALNLSGSGVKIHGFNYGYTINFGNQYCSSEFIVCWQYSDNIAAISAVATDSSSTSLYSATHSYSGADSTTNYSHNYLLPSYKTLSSMGAFAFGTSTVGNASITNKWSNWLYTPDPCTLNPLYSSSCEGYAAAYLTQQCNISALYDAQCPGYAVAYFNQQCTASALYAPNCPGYATAYYNQQCSINALYDSGCPGYATAYKTQQCNLDALYATDCPGYSVAYAKKNILNISTTSTSTTSTTTTSTSTVSTTTPSTSVSSDGTVSTSVAVVSDSNVNAAITQPSTTSATSVSPASPTSVLQQQPVQQVQTQQSQQQSTQSQQPQQQTSSSSSQPSQRQTLQERRMEQARQQAVERGKNLAKDMGAAASLEKQMEVQGVVLSAMAYVPGFDAYGKTKIPDVMFYAPYQVYGNQKTIDNARASRRLFGGSDRLHQEMVDQQYQQGK